jgi:hypothetical protein
LDRLKAGLKCRTALHHVQTRPKQLRSGAFDPLIRGLLRPLVGALLGQFSRFGDQNDRTVRLAAPVAAYPGNPVGAVRFTVYLIGSRGHVARNLTDFGHNCIASAPTIS